jgi:hypothetical protein
MSVGILFKSKIKQKYYKYNYLKMSHLQTYRVPLFNSPFYCRSSTVPEAKLNSETDFKTTPAANSREWEEYSTVPDMKYDMT